MAYRWDDGGPVVTQVLHAFQTCGSSEYWEYAVSFLTHDQTQGKQDIFSPHPDRGEYHEISGR